MIHCAICYTMYLKILVAGNATIPTLKETNVPVTLDIVRSTMKLIKTGVADRTQHAMGVLQAAFLFSVVDPFEITLKLP